MRLRNVLLAATMLAVPVAAKAQPFAPITGLYVGAGAGFDYQFQTDVKNITVRNFTSSVNDTKLRGNGGFVGLASVGFGFGNGLRVEVEGNYRDNVMHLRNNGNYTLNGSLINIQGGGNVQTYGAMANVLYDFNFGLPVVPYIGVGVGYGWTSLEAFNLYQAGSPVHTQVNSDARGGLAVQAIAGVAYNIAAVPGLALTAEVRGYGVIEDTRYSTQVSPTATNSTAVIANSFKLSDQPHISGMLGLRYAFNAAPPPPPPAPAPAPVASPARSYLVFFDWDRYDLTARARQVIAEAAQNSTHVQYTRIEVNGYTDTSGTPQYNLGLSVRRANAVAAELARDGVPRNVMDIHGFGDTRLLVPTGPGVREPQNRRVEIIYH